MDIPFAEPKFEYFIGQRVVLIADYPDGNQELVVGKTGTVCNTPYRSRGDVWVPIRFDERHRRGHDCNGTCERGHGWSTPSRFLAPIEDENDEIDAADETSVMDFLGVV
jgi:hypothetical protein